MRVSTSTMWKIKGLGIWEVLDYKTATKYLFPTKIKAVAYAKKNNLDLPRKRG